MGTQQPYEPVSTRTGVLTPSEFSALDARKAAEVEELITAMQVEHDEAWFATHREGIREDLGFFMGVRLPGTTDKA